MTERWFVARSIAFDDLKAVLQNDRLQWVYAERMETTILQFLSDFLSVDIAWPAWLHGRAFGEKMEVAWWRKDTCVDLRAVVEDDTMLPLPSLWVSDPEGNALTNFVDESLLLVGECNSGQAQLIWTITGMPKGLQYPLLSQLKAGETRAHLRQRVYLRSGQAYDRRLLSVVGGKPNG